MRLTPRPVLLTLLLAFAPLLGACREPGPQPIALGRENCGFCRMAISDARFGAQLVTLLLLAAGFFRASRPVATA